MEGEYGSIDRKPMLSTLWIFYALNILYADVFNLMGSEASTDGGDADLIGSLLSPEMLLGAAIFLELAMVMVVLSRVLKRGINRWLNVVIALVHAFGLLSSVFVGAPAIFYIFFVLVEVVTLLFIVWYAWNWKQVEHALPSCA
ncbi:DUF6326 family protein [Microbulbifer aggregans]|uniref:DUF6326 family protein n=1 Tax=Microbulbifer aggregans TaxID=1769779 RepID=UPI001CFD662A|nr:DUF6326 family protein [Microbulbifer aggregans]